MSGQVNAIQNGTTLMRAQVSRFETDLVPVQNDLHEIKTNKMDGISRNVSALQTSVRNTENDVRTLSEATLEIKDNAAEIKAEMSALETTLSQILENNPDLETNMEALQERNNEIWSDLTKFGANITQLFTVYRRMATNVTSLTRNVTSLQSDTEVMRNQVFDIGDSIGSIQTDVTDLKTTSANLNNAVASHQEFTEITDNNFNQIRTRLDRVSSNITDIRRNISGITRNVRTAQADIAELYSLNRTLTEQSSEVSAASRVEFGVMKGNVERLERILAQYSQVYDEEFEQIKNKNSELELDVATLTTTADDIKDDVIRIGSDVSGLQTDKSQLNSRVDSMVEQNDEIQIGMARFQTDLTVVSANLSGVTRNMTHMNNQIRELYAENDVQQQSIENAEQTLNSLNNQFVNAQSRTNGIVRDLESLNDTIVSISRQVDTILADNFVTLNEIAELQQNLTEFNGDLQTLDDEVETLFLINKTELIRQLNVPIDALIEIVDEIVVSSNRNFDEVKAEIATLERNVTRQYQHVLSRMRDGGLVTGVGPGGGGSLPIRAPAPPGGTGPSAPGVLPSPPGRDNPSTPGILPEVERLWNDVTEIRHEVDAVRRNLTQKADARQVETITQVVDGLRGNLTGVMTTVARMQVALGEAKTNQILIKRPTLNY